MNLPQMVRNLWIYRRLIALAVIAGLTLGFVWSNRQPIEVRFPLLGEIHSTTGVVMLVSGGLAAVATWLSITLQRTMHAVRQESVRSTEPAAPNKPAGSDPPTGADLTPQ